MKKTMVLMLLLTLLVPAATACTEEAAPATETVFLDSSFGEMLALVPVSLLETTDIWFVDQLQAKEMYGVADITSPYDLSDLPDDRRQAVVDAFGETNNQFPSWRGREDTMADTAGFSSMSADAVISIGAYPPRVSTILVGDYDADVIGEKLLDNEYETETYGDITYYTRGDDLEIDIMNPICQIAMAGMNRVYVSDDLLVLSPLTADLTAILDARNGDAVSLADDAMTAALGTALGNPLFACFTTPERLITPPSLGMTPEFDFTVPDDWGNLHDYAMAALGYRADGDARYLDIALYYEDAGDAEKDGETIINRMQDYILNTYSENMEDSAFLDTFTPGEPVVTDYGDGAVLLISCRLPEGTRGIPITVSTVNVYRDLLFLVDDPTPYLGN